MAIDFDKNKINSTGTAEVISSPSVSPVPEPSPSPKPNVEFEGQYYKPSESPSATPTDAQTDAASAARERSAAAHSDAVEETARMKAAAIAAASNAEASNDARVLADAAGNSDEVVSIDRSESSASVETNSRAETHHIENSQEASGYAQILAKNNKTIYQKTSEILDEYIKNHPEEYPQYANMNDKQKRTFRDGMMGKMFRQLAGKQNISQTERKIATRDLAVLLTTIEAKGLSLKEISSNPKQMKSIIAEGDKQLYDFMLSKIDPANPDKALNEIGELYLTFTDPDYLLLQGDAKNAYLKNKQGELFNIIGVKDPKAIPDSSKQNAANIMKSLLQELSNKNLTINDLVKMPAKEQSLLIVKSLDKYVQDHPEIVDKLSSETKHAYAVLKARNSLLQELSDIERPTERDLYNLLLKKEKDGTLTPEQREMFGTYKFQEAYDKKTGKHTLDQEANMSSNVVKTMVTGMSYKAQLNHQLKDVTDKKEIQKVVTEYVSGMLNDSDRVIQLVALREVLMEKGYKPEEIVAMLPKEMVEQLSIRVLANPDKVQASQGTDVLASLNSKAVDDVANAANGVISTIRDAEWLKFYGANVKTTKYDASFSKGINDNLDTNTATQVFAYIATNATTDAKKSSIVQFSLTTTTDSERIRSYTESYKTIKSPAVTEGMAAAAHNTTDAKNKAIINSGVDYAIKNNGYSADEVKNINTARETGQTSYERNASSTDSTNSSSRTSQSTTTNPVSSSSSSAGRTLTASSGSPAVSGGSVSAKVSISPANSNTVSQLKEQLAQVQHEHSIALRDKALDGLQNIIDKIQNDQQVRAQKQAELAAKEAKTDEEISQAIKEAETKSAQEQKKAEEQVAKETLAQIEEQEQLEKKYNISIEKINKLKSAARNGDLSTIYSELGTISADAQKHFVQYLSKKDTATIIGFIRNRSTDKSLIKELCRLNPGLIKSLDANMLMDCGIAKADIIKYSDSHQLAVLMYDLAKVGNTRELNLFYEALGDDAPAVASNISQPVPGDDRYFANLYRNMSTASSKVAMRYDIDKKVPRELWG